MSLGQSLDSSLNSGEEIRFKQKHKKLMTNLSKKINLTYNEIERLAIMYYKLQLVGEGKNVRVRRSLIKDVLHNGLDMTQNDLMPYILSFHDRSVTPYMSLENWIKMMALYLRGTIDEKINYCYLVYKSTGVAEKLIRNNMVYLLRHSLIKDNSEDDEEAVKDMVDMIIKRMDYDRDGKISFDDYRQTVKEAPRFLEAFGPVLPSRIAVYAFKQIFIEHIRKK